jgi:hypothetical protein
MAYEAMYEGDGFIRRGPEPKATDKAHRVSADGKAKAKPAEKARGGQVTASWFSKLVFGR